MQHASNLLSAIYAVYQKPKPFQLPFSLYLKWAQLLPRSLQLYETHLAAGEKHDAVGHAVPAGGYKFRAEATRFPNGLHQSLFNRALEHTCAPPPAAKLFCSRPVHNPVPTKPLLAQGV